MNSFIQNINIQPTKNFQSKVLEYLIEKRIPVQNSFKPNQICISDDAINEIQSILSNTKEVLLIQSVLISDKSIIETLLNLERNGIRIYIIVNDPNESKDLLEALKQKALIRSGVNIHGTMILSDPQSANSESIVFSESLTKENLEINLYDLFKLDPIQIKELYYYYCHLFWNKAKLEVRDKTTYISNSPYKDIPILKEYFLSEGINTIINQNSHSKLSIFSISNMIIEQTHSIQNSSILASLSGMDVELAKNLLDNENDLYLSENPNLKQFIALDQEAYIFPTSKSNYQYSIRLNESQKTELSNVWVSIFSNAGYQGFRSKNYEDIKNEFCFFGEKSWKKIEENKQESLKQDISIEELYRVRNEDQTIGEELIGKFQIQNKLSTEPFALNVQYNLDLLPLSIPKSSSKDKLQTDWDKIKTDFTTKLKEMEKFSELIEEKKKSITEKVLEGLKSFFIGKSQKKSELLTKVQTIQGKDIIKEKSNLVSVINEIIRDLNGDLSEVNLKIEEESAKIQWTEKKAKLENEKKTLECEKSEKEKSFDDFIQNFETEKSNKESSMKDLETQIKNKNSEIQLIEERDKSIKLNIHSLEDQLKTKSSDEEKNNLQEQISSKEKEKENLQTKRKEFISQKIELEKKKKNETENLNTYKNSKGQDRKKKQDETESLKKKLATKEKEISEHGDRFVFKKDQKTSSSSLGGVMSTHKDTKHEISKDILSTLQIQFPREEPPSVGILYNQTNQRYLAILYWEDFAIAVQESKRLNAKLCVIKETNNGTTNRIRD